MNQGESKAFQDVNQLRERLHQLDLSRWQSEALFTWQWWLLIALTIIPLLLWWKIVDKKRAYEIGFYGCLINIFALLLDDFGTNLGWWGYPIKLFPILPPLVTADSVLVPIALMVVYQMFSSNWKTFIVANLILSALLSFAAEPLFMWIGYYQLYTWELLYSFLFYVAAASLARLIILKIVVP